MEHYNPGEPYYDPRNPNLGGPYDRSSKRLRVDDPFEDAERRSRLVRDHGARNSNFDFGLRPPFTRETNIMHHQQDGSMKTGMGTGMSFPIVEHSTLANATKFQNHDQHLALYAQLPKPPHPTTFSGGLGHDYNTHSNVYHHLNYGHSHGSTASFYGGNMPSNNGLVHHDHRSNMPTLSNYSSSHRYNYASPPHFTDVRQPIQTRPPPFGSYHNIPMGSHYAHPPIDFQRGYCTSMSENMGYSHASQGLDVQPPLPSSPPPPLPIEPSIQWSAQHKCLSSPSTVASSLFPVPFTTSAPMPSLHPPISEPNTPVAPLLEDSQPGHTAHGMFRGDYQGTLTSLGQYHGDGQPFPSKHNFPDKHSIIDAVHLFKPPHRTSRPDHFVIILRGLPGSGKSYLAKMLRDLEVKHGGNAPRIHSMDDYFMTEIEKIEENEASKSSARGKKPTMKKVLEYCYEPEMEEAYRSSMLKAFKKTLEEGAFTFVIVDDRNLRVADFAQFWATAKRSGYEVYVLEAPYKDPAGCTARNVHGFTQVDVEKMAAQWEDAPSLYSQVDVKSLLQGDELKESNIQEVDMDTEDGDVDGILIKSEERGVEKVVTSAVLQKDERNWDAEFGISAEEVKDLGRSKWSDNLDDADNERTEVSKRKANVLSGLVKTYGREGKFVHWADQGKHTGFSIGAVKKANLLSLVIGPGAGYNLKSNPLSEEEAKIVKLRETTKRSTFQERLRAEQESFRVVFDRKRQRIGGLDVQD